MSAISPSRWSGECTSGLTQLFLYFCCRHVRIIPLSSLIENLGPKLKSPVHKTSTKASENMVRLSFGGTKEASLALEEQSRAVPLEGKCSWSFAHAVAKGAD